ncbi:MAG: hypothetical protein ACHQUB_02465 [Candidatus Saccharimonadia bacterium]
MSIRNNKSGHKHARSSTPNDQSMILSAFEINLLGLEIILVGIFYFLPKFLSLSANQSLNVGFTGYLYQTYILLTMLIVLGVGSYLFWKLFNHRDKFSTNWRTIIYFIGFVDVVIAGLIGLMIYLFFGVR